MPMCMAGVTHEEYKKQVLLNRARAVLNELIAFSYCFNKNRVWTYDDVQLLYKSATEFRDLCYNNRFVIKRKL